MSKKDNIVRILTEFFNGNEEIKTFRYGSKTAIRHIPVWKTLERLFNNGEGIVTFAQLSPSDGKLLINSLFCSKTEITEINKNLKVPFVLVQLGYPDYYNCSLEYMRYKKENEAKKYQEWLDRISKSR